MESLELHATVRTTTGNNPAKALRREGRVPAILYGPGLPSMLLSLEKLKLDNLIKKHPVRRVLLDLTIDGDAKSPRKAMFKEIQTHPVSQEVLHADFYEVSLERRIRVQVPVIALGKCKGVETGGLLQIIRRRMEIACLPDQIPDAIRIDVTNLGIGDAVHVRDITPPDGVEIPSDVNFTVITVIGAKTEAPVGEKGEAAKAEAPAPGKGKSA